jgi:hypothetical protein
MRCQISRLTPEILHPLPDQWLSPRTWCFRMASWMLNRVDSPRMLRYRTHVWLPTFCGFEPSRGLETADSQEGAGTEPKSTPGALERLTDPTRLTWSSRPSAVTYGNANIPGMARLSMTFDEDVPKIA